MCSDCIKVYQHIQWMRWHIRPHSLHNSGLCGKILSMIAVTHSLKGNLSQILSWNYRKIIFRIIFAIGIIAIILFVLAGAQAFIAVKDGRKLDSESHAYVNSMVPDILDNWDADQLWDNADSDLIQTASLNQIQEFFDLSSKQLGYMKLYGGSQGQARIFVNNFKKDISAEYVSDVTFEKGKGQVQVTLVKKADKWYFHSFYINSPAFSPKPLDFQK